MARPRFRGSSHSVLLAGPGGVQRYCRKEVVGARGFEPPTPRSRTECSTRLSHAPTSGYCIPASVTVATASPSSPKRHWVPLKSSGLLTSLGEPLIRLACFLLPFISCWSRSSCDGTLYARSCTSRSPRAWARLPGDPGVWWRGWELRDRDVRQAPSQLLHVENKVGPRCSP